MVREHACALLGTELADRSGCGSPGERGSTRSASSKSPPRTGTGLARRAAPWRHCARWCSRPKNRTRERNTNSCLGIHRNPRRKIARLLDANELKRLGRAPYARQAEWSDPRSACWRSPAVSAAKCSIFDGATQETIHFSDSKTEPCTVPLGEEARACAPGERRADDFLFPRYAKTKGSSNSPHAGAQRAKTRVSAGCDSTTFATLMSAMPPCPAKTCSCSDTRHAAPGKETTLLQPINVEESQ